jgi:hypothetical protein
MQDNIQEFSDELRELCYRYDIIFENPIRVVQIDDTFESVSMEVLNELPCYGGKDTRGPFIKFNHSKKQISQEVFTPSKSTAIVSDRMLVGKKIPQDFKDMMNHMNKNIKGSQLPGF